jgi:hypothetical protein
MKEIIFGLTLILCIASFAFAQDESYKTTYDRWNKIKKRDDLLYEQRRNQETQRQHQKSVIRENYSHQQNMQRNRLDNIGNMSREYNQNQRDMNRDDHQHYQQMQREYLEHQSQMANLNQSARPYSVGQDPPKVSEKSEETKLEKVLGNPYAWLLGIPILGYLILRPRS